MIKKTMILVSIKEKEQKRRNHFILQEKEYQFVFLGLRSI